MTPSQIRAMYPTHIRLMYGETVKPIVLYFMVAAHRRNFAMSAEKWAAFFGVTERYIQKLAGDSGLHGVFTHPEKMPGEIRFRIGTDDAERFRAMATAEGVDLAEWARRQLRNVSKAS